MCVLADSAGSLHLDATERKQEAAMRAVGYRQSLPITEPASLLDLDLPKPEPRGREIGRAHV